jgi:hypothetical protein
MKEHIKKFLNSVFKIYQKDYIKILSVYLLFFVGFSLVYFSTTRFLSHDDQFFHIRFAEILRQKGFGAFKDFHWVYFSKISQNQQYFIYYNFLFYLVLIPFSIVSPLFLGIKLYGVVMASLVFTIFYFFLLKTKEKRAFIWTLFTFAAVNYASIWRLLMARPFTLAAALLLLELYVIYRKKYWHLFFLSIFYFYWHTATFFFPAGIAVLYIAFESFYGKKTDWKIIYSSVLGTGLALGATVFFAPGLFLYMKNIIFGVYYDTIIGKKIGIAEGGELYSTDFFNFIRSNTIIMALLAIGIVFEISLYIKSKKQGNSESPSENENNKQALRGTLFFLSIVFLFGVFLSARNADFFTFFSAAYIVLTFNLFFKSIKFDNVLVKKSLFVGIIIIIIYLFIGNMLFLHEQISSSGSYESVEGTSSWLKNNTDKGEIVFNPAWGWFTLLFYYNPSNYYVAGIEPRFLYDYSPKLYWTWWNISNFGYVCLQEQCDNIQAQQNYFFRNSERKKLWYKDEGNKIADIIKNDFKSRYIITAPTLKNMNDVLDNNDRFEKVYSDSIYKEYSIYRIK